MHVTRIADGLWRWTGLHPDWTPGDAGANGWEQGVGSVYYEAPDAVVLIDPIAPPEDAKRFWTALDRDVARAGRPVHVLLTVFWHGRSSGDVADRYGAEVWAHERARAVERKVEPTQWFSGAEKLPGGIEPRDVPLFGETIFWIPEHRALVF